MNFQLKNMCKILSKEFIIIIKNICSNRIFFFFFKILKLQFLELNFSRMLFNIKINIKVERLRVFFLLLFYCRKYVMNKIFRYLHSGLVNSNKLQIKIWKSKTATFIFQINYLNVLSLR